MARMKTFIGPEVNMDMSVSEKSYKMKIELNKMQKLAEELGIPCFIAIYSPINGYEYGGVLPEDCTEEDAGDQYGKFIEFFKVCAKLNEESKKPVVKRK